MIKKIYILPFLFLSALLYYSCDETVEVGKYDNWQVRNETFIDSLQQVIDGRLDPDLLALTDSRNRNQTIFFKKLPGYPATSNVTPILTSTVKVFYKGMLIDESVFGRSTEPRYYTKLYDDLVVFDSNFSGPDPTEFDNPTTSAVTNFISGWIEVLQNMKVGERWEIYVPYGSGYGPEVYGSIPGYSTLIFDIQLVDITEY